MCLTFCPSCPQNDTLRKLVDAEAAERQRLQQLSAALEAQVGAGLLLMCLHPADELWG